MTTPMVGASLTAPPTPLPQQIPRLENGDRLTRDEFERRYAAMPHVNQAELLEGIVHMPSPVRIDQHGKPHAQIMTWLGHYWAHVPDVVVGDNSSIRLDLDNEPQPDAVMFIAPERGGRVRISDDGYVEGAPELVAEVAASSVSIDLHTKFRVYRRNQVGEYLVWRVLDQAIDWFSLRGGDYQRLAPDTDGCVQSQIFPGLWLDASAILRGDLASVLRTLDRGLASPACAEFAARLRAKPT